MGDLNRRTLIAAAATCGASAAAAKDLSEPETVIASSACIRLRLVSLSSPLSISLVANATVRILRINEELKLISVIRVQHVCRTCGQFVATNRRHLYMRASFEPGGGHFQANHDHAPNEGA